MPKYAYIDGVTSALIGGGYHPSAPDERSIPVADDFDFTARDKKWNGGGWDPYVWPPPPTAQQSAKLEIDTLELYFRACMLVILDQLNVERNRHGAGAIAPAQMWQAIKDKVDTL